MAPRDDLAGAVVPEGTAPGGEFSVPVVRRRRGEAVQESKKELLAGVGQLANHSTAHCPYGAW